MFSVFATLGDVLISPKLSPSGFDVQQGATFAEHALFSRPPRLQYTGRELDALSLIFDLHFSFCTPVEEKKKLETMLREHQAHPLVFGDGSWWGYFVLERLSTTLEQCGPTGTPWLISMQAELKEFTGDPAKPPERPAVSDGAPSLAVYPGSASLLSLAAPLAGGLWDTMRTAVSYAQQARGIISEATGLVQLARDVANAGNPFDAVSLALGGADRLGGLLGKAGGLASGLGEALGACAAALPLESMASIGASLKTAIGAAGELAGVVREGAALASALGVDTGNVGRMLGQVDSCLTTGASCLDRCAPALQWLTAQVTTRQATGAEESEQGAA